MNYCGKIIKVGSKDEVSIKAIKVRLNTLLGSKLDVQNGNFGTSTESVVKQFQKKAQLIQDGVIGELTWERLFTESTEVKPHSNLLRFRALEIADTQLFVREKTGKNDGVDVEGYLKTVGLGKGYAWCMAFVYWLFLKAATDLKVTNPVPKTAGVLDCYAKAKKLGYVIDKKDVQPGDQGIMDFGGGKGHTFIVTELKGDTHVYTVEGNTSADPTYAGEDREGNGVFERNRSIASIKAFIRYE